jgi:SAM-dependent methyltransferase
LTLRSPIQDETMRLLLGHPDVTDVVLVDEEGFGGHEFTVAYVVPDAERMKAAKSRIYAAERDRRIVQWRKTFDQTYRRGPDNNAPAFTGWTSNFTNKPISEIEMREWLDCTVKRITAFAPQRILEVGCGVGLLTERLAPACSAYCGTDLSPVAVSRLREFVTARAELRHVELLECEATEFEGLPQHAVDMVVLNSVAQYFPSIDYLHSVLQQAAERVAPGGHIFVGDVRDLGLLPTFHGAVELAKAPSEASGRWLKRKVSLAIEQERELVIDPRFFLGLPQSIPRITGAEVLLKRGSNNELTRYRYDVLLHVEGPTAGVSRHVPEWQAGDAGLEELLARFDKQRLAEVHLLNMPNSRVAADLAAVRSIWRADDRQSVRDIRAQQAEPANAGIDPEACWQRAEMLGYDVRLGCTPFSAEGHFDAALADRAQGFERRLLQRSTTARSDSAVATDPMAAAYMQQLGLELGNLLRVQLPEAHVPAAVIALNKLPSAVPMEAPSLALAWPSVVSLGWIAGKRSRDDGDADGCL